MTSFLPVIVSKKNKQTEKYVFYCSVSQSHINPEKTRKTHHNDCLNVPTVVIDYKSVQRWRMVQNESQLFGIRSVNGQFSSDCHEIL